MAAPTFVAEYEASFSGFTTPKNVAATEAVDDVFVVVGGSESNATGIGTPTGGGLTFALQQSISVLDFCSAYGYTAVADSAQAFTLSVPKTGSNNHWGYNTFRFSGSSGVGNSAKANVASGAPTLNITTTQANSAIVVVVLDWTATDGASRTWRTVNGVTPSVVSGEQTYYRDSARYTVYAAYYSDVGAAGVKTVGLSAPAGQKYSIIAIEVKGAAAGTAPVGATDLATSWRTLAGVTSDLVTSWRVAARVTSDLVTSWRVYTPVTPTNLATSWRVYTPTGATNLATSWRVQARVAADLTTSWRVSAAVGSTDLATSWRVYAPVGATDLATTWRVLSSLTSVTSDLVTTWRVAARITSDLATSWRVSARVTSDLTAMWRVHAPVGASDLATSWRVLQAVVPVGPTDLVTSWKVYALAGATDLITAWRVLIPPVTLRPFAGLTSRPASGTSARPSTGLTVRPGTGTIIPPNAGITARP